MIHPTAIIDPSARIAENVEIGPWTLIGSEVEIGSGTRIGSHVVIQGPTHIGQDNHIFQFSSLGEMPQDKKFRGENTLLKIGDRNTIREFCTFNRGTVQDKGITQIGDDNLFMAYVHIAHDCVIGNSTIFVNNASLAGHVTIEDYVILAGFSGIFQNCRVGMHGFVSMGALVDKDVPPFVRVAGGDRSRPCGLNTVGMQRHGYTPETILNLRRAYKIIYRKGLTAKQAVTELEGMLPACPDVQLLIHFLQISQRGIIR